MTRVMVLAGKEWHELRWFVFLAVAFVLGFPLVASHRPDAQFYAEFCGALVLSLGGVFAVFVAVGSTCRDLKDPLQTFWQSRPIGLGRLLATKYVAGLLVVLVVCTAAVAIPLAIYAADHGSRVLRVHYATSVLTCHTFSLVLIYSVSFLIGCLVRHAAHAAILSAASGLLIYFLPVVFGPLGWLSVYTLMIDRQVMFTPGTGLAQISLSQVHMIAMHSFGEHSGVRGFTIPWLRWTFGFKPEYIRFVMAMLACSALAAILAWLAVLRDWRLRLDMRLMVWMLGAVALILFGSTAFALRSNLECEQRIPVAVDNADKTGHVARIVISDQKGVLLLRRYTRAQMRYSLCRFDISGAEPVFDQPVPVDLSGWRGGWLGSTPPVAWVPEYPDRAYLLKQDVIEEDGTWRRKGFALWTVALEAPADQAIVHELDLWDVVADERYYGPAFPDLFYRDKVIYALLGAKVAVIGIEDADAPRLLQVVELKVRASVSLSLHNAEPVAGTVMLFPLPGLDPRERLGITLGASLFGSASFGFKDELLVAATAKALTTYRLSSLDENTATFEPIGRRAATPLERLLGIRPSVETEMIISDGFAYVLVSGINDGVMVYDVREPQRPRRIGHYAASEVEYVATMVGLPDGRLLLGGGGYDHPGILHVLAPLARTK